MQMSGFPKVEMSAWTPQWRHGGDGGLTMGELDRLQIMTRLAERRLTRRRAAALLGLSERQVRRLYRAFQREGAAGLGLPPARPPEQSPAGPDRPREDKETEESITH